MWVVSKIIGDGKSTATAYRCAMQDLKLPAVFDESFCNPLTGKSFSTFMLAEVPDSFAGTVSKDGGCFVVPNFVNADAIQLNTFAGKLADVGCPVFTLGVSATPDLIARIRQKTVTDLQNAVSL